MRWWWYVFKLFPFSFLIFLKDKVVIRISFLPVSLTVKLNYQFSSVQFDIFLCIYEWNEVCISCLNFNVFFLSFLCPSCARLLPLCMNAIRITLFLFDKPPENYPDTIYFPEDIRLSSETKFPEFLRISYCTAGSWTVVLDTQESGIGLSNRHANFSNTSTFTFRIISSTSSTTTALVQFVYLFPVLPLLYANKRETWSVHFFDTWWSYKCNSGKKGKDFFPPVWKNNNNMENAYVSSSIMHNELPIVKKENTTLPPNKKTTFHSVFSHPQKCTPPQKREIIGNE